MSRLNRLATRTAVVTLAGVSALGLATATASAKSDIEFSAGPRTIHVGGRIHLKGSGDNDDYFFKRFCVQERTGHQAWHNLRCAKGGDGSGGSVTMNVKATRRGIYEFRGVLFEDWHKRLEPSAASDVYRVMVR